MNYTQNRKIMQVTETTLVVGVDIGSQWHYARAFDWRGIELTRKVFRFSNDLDGYIAFEEWVQSVSEKSAKMDNLIGCEPTGHYWFTFAKYVKEHGMKLAFVNPTDSRAKKQTPEMGIFLFALFSRSEQEFKTQTPVSQWQIFEARKRL